MKYIIVLILAIVCGTLFFLAADYLKTESSTNDLPAVSHKETTDNALPTENRSPVLVELFTSEGCSSCPSADKTLEFLAREQPINGAEIIALSQHVDYWNRLGWTDPFSSDQFSRRQSEYSGFFKQNNVYTPQMIVDGTREFVGSNMREAQKSIVEAAKVKKAAINLSAQTDKDQVAFNVKVADLPESFESAIVLLAITEDNLISNVVRGENGGQKLTHVAVARSLNNIGIVTAAQKTFAVTSIVKLQKNWKSDYLNAIVFVQDLKSRQVLAIAKIGLKANTKL